MAGLALLDEAILPASVGRLGPVATGIVAANGMFGGAMTGPYSRALGKPQFNAVAAHLLRASKAMQETIRLPVLPAMKRARR